MGAGWNAPAGVPWSPDISLGDIAGLQSPAGEPLGTSDQQATITGMQNAPPPQNGTPQPPPPTATGTSDPGTNVISGTTPVDQYGNALDASNQAPPGSLGDVMNQMGAFKLEPFDFAQRYQDYNAALQNAYSSSIMPHLDPSTRPGLLANLATLGMAGVMHHDYEAHYNARVDEHNANMHAAAARDALSLTAQDATYHAAGLNRQMQALGMMQRIGHQNYGDFLKWTSAYKEYLRPPPSPDEAELLANNGRRWEPVVGGLGMIFDQNGPVAPIKIPPPPFMGGGTGGFTFPGGPEGAGMPGGPTGGGGSGGAGGYGGPTGRGAAPVHARPVNPASPYGRAANPNPTGSAPGKPPTQNAPAPGGAAPSDPAASTTTTAPPTSAGGTTGSTTGTTLPTTENRALMAGTKKEAEAFATAKGKSKEQFEASAQALENSLNNPDFNKFVNNLLPQNVNKSTLGGMTATQINRGKIAAMRLAGNDPAKLVDLNNMRRQLDNIIANIGIQGGRSSSGMRLSMQMIEKFEGQWQQLASGNMSREMAQAFRASVLKEIQNARKAIDNLQWVPPSQRGTPADQGGGGGALVPGATGTLSSGRKFTINP